MPVRAANTRILIDQFDFSQQSKGLSLAIANDALDANTLQSTERNSLPGWPEATLDLSGYFNGVGAGQLEQELQSRLGSETPCVVSVILGTVPPLPYPAYVLPSTWGNQLKIDAPLKELLLLTGQWQQAARRGMLILSGAITVVANQAIRDLGAVPAGDATGWAALHVLAVSGAVANATAVVQMATDEAFSSPSSYGTFTINGVGAQTMTLTGAMKRYSRINFSSLGGATSITVAIIVGVSGVTG